jgi:hypothetical protein
MHLKAKEASPDCFLLHAASHVKASHKSNSDVKISEQLDEEKMSLVALLHCILSPLKVMQRRGE